MLKAAELANPELTLGSSGNDIDKILVESLCQLDHCLPPTAIRPKLDNKESNRFATVATYGQI